MGSFPADFAAAISSGKVTADILQRYLDLEKKFFIGWLMQFPGGWVGGWVGGWGWMGCRGREGSCRGGAGGLGVRGGDELHACAHSSHVLACAQTRRPSLPSHPPGFRERFMADPGFLVKLAIEVCVGGGG